MNTQFGDAPVTPGNAAVTQCNAGVTPRNAGVTPRNASGKQPLPNDEQRLLNAERHLDEVTIRQLTWKPGTIRNLAVNIVERVLKTEILWPDQLSLDGLAASDRHAVGVTWRMLRQAGIIAQTGNYRRSNSATRNAGSVFQYRLASRAKAETFLKRNGVTVTTPQQELLALN